MLSGHCAICSHVEDSGLSAESTWSGFPQEAVRAAATEGEAGKWRGQAAVLRRKRAPRLERWQAAFQLLHAELKALKRATDEYRLTVRGAAAQQEQQQQICSMSLLAT